MDPVEAKFREELAKHDELEKEIGKLRRGLIEPVPHLGSSIEGGLS